MPISITHGKRNRLKHKGAVYHVITRCNNKEGLIKTNQDFEKYISILGECKKKFAFLLYDYALLTTHNHLCIRVMSDDDNISKIMHAINRFYARWYNFQYKRKGHFWEDRFYADLIENDSQLLAVMRYIDLNPPEAGLCKTPAEWKYSGACSYLKGTPNDLIDIPDVYLNLGETRALRQKAYMNIFPLKLPRF